MTTFAVCVLSKKDSHVIMAFPPYEPMDYHRACAVMAGTKKRLPSLSQPGSDGFLMIRPLHTQPDPIWTEPDLGDPIVKREVP